MGLPAGRETPMNAHHVIIHLAPWERGREVMQRVAQEYAQRYSWKENMLVTVYGRDGSIFELFTNGGKHKTTVRQALDREDFNWYMLPDVWR